MQLAQTSSARALALSEEIGDSVLRTSAWNYVCHLHHTVGNYVQAMQAGRQALECSDAAVASAVARGVFTALPAFLLLSQAELGAFSEALADGEALMRRVEPGGHPFALSLMCIGIGYAHMRRGAAVDAIPLLERGINLCQAFALDVQIPWTASTLGMAYALAGHHKEGVGRAEEAVRCAEVLGINRYQPLRTTLLANAYLLADRFDDAHATAQEALELARRHHERGPEAWSHYLVATSMAQYQPAKRREIDDCYQAAQRLADELGMRPLIAHCHLGLGQLHATLNDAPKAREHLGQALALYREMGMQLWPDQAEAALNELGAR